MSTLLRSGWFALDIGLVAAGAWLLVRQLAADLETGLEQLLAWGLAGLALIAGAGVLLGEIGGLQIAGFAALHTFAFAALAVARRKAWWTDVTAARELAKRGGAVFRGPATEAVPAGLLALAMIGFVGLAIWSNPVVFDALTYRLSRIGHWLQEGRITVITTDDARLNYMPVVPDLVMAWLMSPTAVGFQPVALAQTIGGGLLLGATVLLARLTGLSRGASFAAGLLVLGLPNIMPQFTSAYTDLFTAGVLSAGFALWLGALRRGRGSWLGGLAAGLAIGSKGTTAYIAPGLAIAICWLAWRHRTSLRAWRSTLTGALLGLLVFSAPAAWRNFRTFGSPVGPKDFVELHHGITPGWHGSREKLGLNLSSALAQLCEPNSQPPWWRAATRAVGEAVIRRLPDHDPFAFDELNRHANLEKVYAVAAPDADVASTGVLLPCLGVAALITACWQRKRTGAPYILTWSAIVGVFVLFMHWRVQWHPYLFRFLILAVPWMAVMAMWWLARWPRGIRLATWTVVGATTAYGFVAGTFNTYQSGWPAATAPAQSTGFYVFQQWRAWSQTLNPNFGPLRPHLPVNAALAAFYRRGAAQRIEPGKLTTLTNGTAQDRVKAYGDGWLIVPAAKFIGQEGEVVARTSLFDGDEHNPFSLAAYRTLSPGEQPPPVLYRNRSVDTNGRTRRELLLRTWSKAPVRIELINRGKVAREFEAHSPLEAKQGRLAAGERKHIEMRVPANFPALVTIDSDMPTEDGVGRLEAGLVP